MVLSGSAVARPRTSMCLMASVNLGIFACSCALAFLGAVAQLDERLSVAKGTSATEGLSYITRMLPPGDTDMLNDYVLFTPAILVAAGFIGACIALTGCKGAFSGGMCHLVCYSVFAIALLAPQGYGTYILASTNHAVADQASALVKRVWESKCRCASESSSTSCEPSVTECFDPSVKESCLCRPCKDYVTESLCSQAGLETPETCSAHVRSLITSTSMVVLELIVALLVLEVVSLILAFRIGVWTVVVGRAERSQERLLAEVYSSSEENHRV